MCHILSKGEKYRFVFEVGSWTWDGTELTERDIFTFHEVRRAATTQVPELTIIKKMKTVIEMQIIRHCWGSAVLDFSNTIKG